jgi:transposase-like protein
MKLSKQEKYELILRSLKERKTVEELCKRMGIGVSTLYKWRNRFLYAGKQSLAELKTGPKARPEDREREQQFQQEKKRLEQRLAELATENEILKKNENWIDEG